MELLNLTSCFLSHSGKALLNMGLQFGSSVILKDRYHPEMEDETLSLASGFLIPIEHHSAITGMYFLAGLFRRHFSFCSIHLPTLIMNQDAIIAVISMNPEFNWVGFEPKYFLFPTMMLGKLCHFCEVQQFYLVGKCYNLHHIVVLLWINIIIYIKQ